MQQVQRESKRENFAHSFKHFECLQLHCFCFFGVASFASELGLDFDFGDSGFLNQININWELQKGILLLAFYEEEKRPKKAHYWISTNNLHFNGKKTKYTKLTRT